jgi:hypothetical protein
MNASRLRFLSLWAINDGLSPIALKKQMNELKETGLTGVVFHPRFYPGNPPYMSESYLKTVSDLILHARDLGMEFWIYDENGWPSGTAGGQVLQRLPNSVCEWIEWHTGSCGVYCEKAEVENKSEGNIAFLSKVAVSSLDRRATEMFIALTHEGYRKGLQPEAFDYITGFFTDEVGFLDGHGVSVSRGGIPWHDSLPAKYEAKYGERLEPLLPLLFIDGEGSGKVRTRFWELLTDALIDGFYRPIEDWCTAHGKLFTGHLKAEENPFFQLTYSGSCFQVLKGLTIPAIDALERHPGNNFYPRIVHSLAMQQGREGCLVEAHGGSGWGTSPESFTEYVLWLASHGIERFVFHLAQFKLTSHAVHDWPPSMPLHLTWRDAFPSILDGIRRRTALLPELRDEEPELLIVTPTRGVMASFDPRNACAINEHNGDGVPNATASGAISNSFIEQVEKLHAAGVHYELTEERAIEEDALIADGSVKLGLRRYGRVLLPNGCRWLTDDLGITAADRMRASGIEVMDDSEGGIDTWLDSRGQTNVLREEVAAHDAFFVPEQSAWTATVPQANRLALDWTVTDEGRLEATIVALARSLVGPAALVLLDLPQRITLNGDVLVGQAKEIGFRYELPNCEETTELRFILMPAHGAETHPVGWLEGDFCVRSASVYKDKSRRQLQTNGPFQLDAPHAPDPADLIRSGWPFCGGVAILFKTLILDKDTGPVVLKLIGVNADAARLELDGADLGWCWGPDWSFELPRGLAAGRRELAIHLVPSTYNVFGPHRHIDGDRHLVSPDQYAGVRNFADHPDAPVNTLSDFYHFIRWGITGDVLLRMVGT